MLSQHRGDVVVVIGHRVIQGCLPAISCCTAVEVGAMRDEQLGRSPIGLGIATAARRTTHSNGVQCGGPHNRVLIHVRATL